MEKEINIIPRDLKDPITCLRNHNLEYQTFKFTKIPL